jgi:hypothetical protein
MVLLGHWDRGRRNPRSGAGEPPGVDGIGSIDGYVDLAGRWPLSKETTVAAARSFTHAVP